MISFFNFKLFYLSSNMITKKFYIYKSLFMYIKILLMNFNFNFNFFLYKYKVPNCF